MRIFVVGLGSIGRRHLENARSLGHEAAGGRLPDAGGWRPDALVVASPTSAHPEAIAWAAERGIHVYVEKPLAASTASVASLIAAADSAGLTIAAGYNLRFHPALETVKRAIAAGEIGRLLAVRAEVGHYLPDWHPGDDYRRSYAARSDLGGGALLTLSHELDYVRWIAGEVERVAGTAARVSSLEIDVDDIADVMLRHASGTVSSVHMDMIDRDYSRRSRWIGEHGTIDWSWGSDVLRGGEVLWRDENFDLNETYVAALRDFVAAVQEGRPPRATASDGLRVLEICEAVAAA